MLSKIESRDQYGHLDSKIAKKWKKDQFQDQNQEKWDPYSKVLELTFQNSPRQLSKLVSPNGTQFNV